MLVMSNSAFEGIHALLSDYIEKKFDAIDVT